MKSALPEVASRSGWHLFTRVLALGEVALIFIGVMLALAVDGWQQKRSDRQLEMQYLRALLEDVDAEIEDLDDVLERSETRITEPLRVAAMELVNNELVDDDPVAFVNRIGMLSYVNLMRWRRGTYLDLISSGHSGLIESFELRQQIFRYYSSPDYYEQYFEAILDMRVGFESHTVPWRLFQYETSLSEPLPPSALEFGLEAMLDDPVLENAVFQSLSTQAWIARVYENHRERAGELAESLRRALASKT